MFSGGPHGKKPGWPQACGMVKALIFFVLAVPAYSQRHLKQLSARSVIVINGLEDFFLKLEMRQISHRM